MSEKFPMTPSGFASMKAHLKRLKDVETKYAKLFGPDAD